MHRNKKYIIFTLLYFYMVFTFTFHSINFIQRLLIYLVPVIYITLNLKSVSKQVNLFSKPVLLSYVSFAILMIMSFSVPVIYQTNDFSYLRLVPILMLKLTLKHLFLFFVFLRMYKEKASFILYAKHYIIACCVYVLSSIVLIIFPTLKEFWISLLHMSELDSILITYEHHASRVGIDGFAAFFQTFLMSMGILLNTFLIIDDEMKGRLTSNLYYISLFTMTLGTLFYGRIGSLVAFSAILFIIVYFLSNKQTLKKGIIILTSILAAILVLIIVSSVSPAVMNWTNWAFDYIRNFISSGTFSNESIQEMFDMYFVPEFKTIIIGDGYYTDPITGLYYYNVDIGFLRSILFFGLIPTVIGYLVIIFLLWGMFTKFKENRNKAGMMFVTALLFTIILFELKGGTFYFMYPLLLPYYFLLSLESR